MKNGDLGFCPESYSWNKTSLHSNPPIHIDNLMPSGVITPGFIFFPVFRKSNKRAIKRQGDLSAVLLWY